MTNKNWCVATLGLWLMLGLSATEAGASCTMRSLTVWPPSGAIPTNAVFLVSAYGMDQDWLRGLRPCELRLASESHDVCLTGLTSYEGGMRLVQTLMEPEEDLISGEVYRLSYVPSDPSPSSDQWARTSLRDREKRTWAVGPEGDHLAPTWRGRPEVKEIQHYLLGCGPVRQALVDLPTLDENPLLTLVTVQSSDGSEHRQYLLPVGVEPIGVGHGMCSGAFDLKPGKTYQATFELMDVAGNFAAAHDEAVQFEIPEHSREPSWY